MVFLLFLHLFCKKVCKWKIPEKRESTRDAIEENISLVNAIEKRVWQKVYVAPHPILGWYFNVFIAFSLY